MLRSFNRTSGWTARFSSKLLPRNTTLLSRLSSSYITDDNIIRNSKSIDFPKENVFSFFERNISKFGDQAAMVDCISGIKLTYTDLLKKSRKLSSFYRHKGYKPGDCAAIHVPNCIEYGVTAFGTLANGMTLTTANSAYTSKEINHQLRNSNSKLLFTNSALLDIAKKSVENTNAETLICIDEASCNDSGVLYFNDIINSVEGASENIVNVDSEQDVGMMLYSSGTTGLPKGVELTHQNIICNAMQIAEALGDHIPNNVLCVLPLYHVYGMVYIMLVHLLKGITIHTLPSFNPETFLAALQDYKLEKVCSVPPMVLFLLNHPMVAGYDLSSFQNVTVGAAPIDENVLNAFAKNFPNVLLNQGYGMTESMVTHMQGFEVSKNKPGSAGTVLCNIEWKVQCLVTGKALPAYEKGEVCTRGPQVMKGYHNNKEETEKCLKDGWMHSGDLGYYDEDFNIFVVDRLKELIKYKGFQVAPAELEDLLLGHDDIIDSCVIGLPDEKAGEVPFAFVVKRKSSSLSLTEEDVHSYVNEHVSAQKRLRGGVKFVEALPRSPAGKLLRRVLKEEYSIKK